MEDLQKYKEAQLHIDNLKKELEKVIAICKSKGNQYQEWLTRNFEPAHEALISKEKSPVKRLSRACLHLQIFGGMGSWSDVGIDTGDGLYQAYTNANNFYQDCWEQGIV